MKSKEKNIVTIIINYLLNILIIIFGIILLISIYNSVQTKFLGHDYNNFFGYSIFEVQTGSMADTINIGDWIFIKLTKKVALNDIVTYESNGQYITHRIVEVYNGTYITKGDANSDKDEAIEKNQIIGKVVYVLPGLGIVKKILSNLGVIVMIIITLFLFNLGFKKSKAGQKFNQIPVFNVIFEKINLFFNRFYKEEKNDVSKVESQPLAKKEQTIVADHKYSEEDLEKTALYRIITVDADEFNNKLKKKNFLKFIIKKIILLFKKFILWLKNNKIIEKISKIKSLIKIKKEGLEINNKESISDEDKKEEYDNKELVRQIPNDEYRDDQSNVSSSSQSSSEAIEDSVNKDNELENSVISIDSNEMNDTFLEIAKNEMIIAEQKESEKEKMEELAKEQEEKNKVEAEAEVEEEDDSLTDIDLELIKNRRSKDKNIIDTAMFIKEEEINELIDILVKNDPTYINKPTIKDIFIDTYINARYYNFYGDKDFVYSGKNSISKIEKIIKNKANELINKYRRKDPKFKYKEIINNYKNIFILIANLEQGNDSITKLKAKSEFYKKQIKKYAKDWNSKKIENVIIEIMKVQKKYMIMLEDFFNKLSTNIFELKFNPLSTKKDMYGLELVHNVSFSKVYSNYIIDKTYTEGVIAEDKQVIVLTLLSIQLIKDMLSSDFNRKYILYFPISLYSKERKYKKLLKMFDNEYTKENVILVVTFEDLLANKRIIKETKRRGYKFALALNKEIMINSKDRNNLYIANYIFVNNKLVDSKIIPEDLLNIVIYEDIVNKVGDFGSE